MKRIFKAVLTACVALLAAAAVVQTVQAASDATYKGMGAIYRQQGGNLLTVDSGGTLEVLSGATLNAVSATVNLPANQPLTGATVNGNLVVNGNTTLGAGATNQLVLNGSSVTVPAGTAAVSISTGGAGATIALDLDSTNQRLGINTGTPGFTLDANGAAAIRGQLTVVSASATIQGAASLGSSGQASFSASGVLTLPSNGLAVGSNQLAVAGGLVGIGTASPTQLLSLSSGTIYLDGNAANSLQVIGRAGIGAVAAPSAALTITAASGDLNAVKISSNNATQVAALSQAGVLSLGGSGVSGGVNISSGASAGQTLSGLFSATAAFNPGTITANSCVDSSAITVTGAADGEPCIGSFVNANASVTGVFTTCYVTGVNSVKARACCSNGASTCATTSQTVRVTVLVF